MSRKRKEQKVPDEKNLKTVNWTEVSNSFLLDALEGAMATFAYVVGYCPIPQLREIDEKQLRQDIAALRAEAERRMNVV